MDLCGQEKIASVWEQLRTVGEQQDETNKPNKIVKLDCQKSSTRED